MTIDELRTKLQANNVPEHWYSLDQGLKPDACILYKNYSKWEYFYLDERGNRNDWKILNTDEEAYDHLWKKMEYQLNVFRKPPK